MSRTPICESYSYYIYYIYIYIYIYILKLGSINTSIKDFQKPHEVKCKTPVVKMSFICLRIKTCLAHLTSLGNLGFWQLGNGLLCACAKGSRLLGSDLFHPHSCSCGVSKRFRIVCVPYVRLSQKISRKYPI